MIGGFCRGPIGCEVYVVRKGFFRLLEKIWGVLISFCVEKGYWIFGSGSSAYAQENSQRMFCILNIIDKVRLCI